MASDAKLSPKRPHPNDLPSGLYALLTGHQDGIALYLPGQRRYGLIKLVDPEGEVQPDMPKWLPINRILTADPTRH